MVKAPSDLRTTNSFASGPVQCGLEEPLQWEPPTVLIQLPLYNELCVAGRPIRAASEIDCPLDRLGNKAGALARGVERSRAGLVALFDAKGWQA